MSWCSLAARGGLFWCRNCAVGNGMLIGNVTWRLHRKLFPEAFRWCYRGVSSIARDLGEDGVSQLLSKRQRARQRGKLLRRDKRGRRAMRRAFVDMVRVSVQAGTGGDGCQSFDRSGRNRRPDGGHGGDGGWVIVVAEQSVFSSLSVVSPRMSADNGGNGSSQGRNGRNGRNRIIRVPCGVVVRQILDHNQQWDPSSGRVVTIAPSLDEDDDIPSRHDLRHDADWDSSTQSGDDSDEDYDDSESSDEEDREQERQTDQLDHSNISVDVTTEGNGDEKGKGKSILSESPNEIVHLSSALAMVSSSIARSHSPFSGSAPNEDEPTSLASGNNAEVSVKRRCQGLLRVLDQQNSSIRATTAVEDLSDDDEEWVARSDDGDTISPYGDRRKKVLLADLDRPGSYVVVARGGTGGVGNVAFPKLLHEWGYAKRNGGERRPPARWRHRAANHMADLAQGTEGERSLIEMELKLIADVGLVGFPNAGKSSLLGALSRAAPEVAPYPFTTLNPIIGCIEYRDGFQVIAADVPGLISGASGGRGKGYDFLRHLERTKVLLYVVDAASVDGRHPVEDLEVLVQEIGAYSGGEMLLRPALIVANKIDLIHSENELNSLFRDISASADTAGIALSDHRVYGISAGVSGEGLLSLSRAIRRIVQNHN